VDILDWVLLVAIESPVVAYAIGGVMHTSIDFAHGRRLLRKYWAATDAKVARIREDVVADLRGQLGRVEQLVIESEARLADRIPVLPPPPDLVAFKAELLAELPAPPDLQPLQDQLEALPTDPIGENALQTAFEAFLRSQSGVQWATELGNLAADKILEGLRNLTTSKAGNQARTAQAGMARQLLTAMNAIDFGNPIVNGAWVALGPGPKLAAANQIARLLRRTGFVLVPMGELAEDGAEVLDVEGGPPKQALPWYDRR